MSQSHLFGATSPAAFEPYFSVPELREMLGCADFWKWRFDPVTRELTISDIDDASGRRPHDGLTEAVSEALDQVGNRALLIAAIEAASTRHSGCRFDWPLILGDGETHWIRFFAGPAAGLGRRWLEVRGVAFSIDGERRSNFQARCMQDQLDAVVRVLPQAIVIIDAGCRAHALNAPAERLLGCLSHEVIGRPLTHFVPPFADGLNRLLARAHGAAESVEGRPSGIVRIVRKDGSSVLTKVSVAAAGRSPRMMFVLVLVDAGAAAKGSASSPALNGYHRPLAPGLMTRVDGSSSADGTQSHHELELEPEGESGLAAEDDAVTCAQALMRGAAEKIRKASQLLQSSAEASAGIARNFAAAPTPDPAGSRFRRLVAQLTPRERQVFRQVVRGRTNKEIGRDLAISPRTVEAYRAKIMVKTMCQSMPALIRGAVRAGFV